MTITTVGTGMVYKPVDRTLGFDAAYYVQYPIYHFNECFDWGPFEYDHISSLDSLAKIFPLQFGDIEFKDSVTTLFTDKKAVVRLIPKKVKKTFDLKKYLRVPVKPLFNPPKWSKLDSPPTLREWKVYPFRAPKRFPSETDQHYDARKGRKFDAYTKHVEKSRLTHMKSYDNRRKKWDTRRRAHYAKLDAYNSAYTKRVRKYEARVRLLAKRRDIVEKWKHTPASGRSRLRYTEDHPFRYLKLLGTGSGFLFYPMFWLIRMDGNGVNVHAKWHDITDLPTVSSLYGRTAESFHALLLTSSQKATIDLNVKLLSKLHSKIKAADFHVGNIIAERKQTYDMLADIVKRFASLATGKKRLITSVVSFIKNPKKIADDLLAFEFGVLPLLSDASALGKKIAQWETSDGDLVFRVNGHVPISFPIGDNSDFMFNGVCEISYVVKLDVDFGASRYLSELGLINPAEIAWEIMPWSFVVDWFLPVQSWIESLSSQIGLRFKTGTCKTRLLGTLTSSGSGSTTMPRDLTVGDIWGSNDVNDFHYDGGFVSVQNGNFSVLFKDRRVLTSIPEMDRLVLRNAPFSLTHVIESIALIVQRMKWLK